MEPDRLTINRGDYVRWINADTGEHTVRAFDLEFESPVLQPNETYWRPFLKTGTYLYDCRFHRHYFQFPPDAGARNSPNFDPLQYTPRIIVVDPGSAPGSGTASPPASTAKTHDVKIGSGGFEPGSLSIKAGDTVRWTNKDNSLHNVQTDDHSWGSPPLPSGAVWSRTFPQSGAVLYHCHFHHEMTARLTVNP
jgi:plastocyanin